jgi:hypothetical protein
MILGGLAVLVGLFIPPLGQVLATLDWPFVAYTNRMVAWLGSLPVSSIWVGRISVASLAVIYALILLFYASNRPWGKLLAWVRPVVVLLVTSSLALMAWSAVFARPDGHLHLTFWQQGGGVDALARLPDGQTVLLHSGLPPDVLDDALGRSMQAYGGNLSALVLLDESQSALQGLPQALTHLPPAQVFYAVEAPSAKAGAGLLNWLDGQGKEAQVWAAGQDLALGDEIHLRLLAHTPTGNAVLLEWQRLRVLIPGGAPWAQIKAAAGENLDGVSVLLLGDADLVKTTAADWQALAPRSVLWYGQKPLPAAAWLNLTAAQGVEIESDGGQMWLWKK